MSSTEKGKICEEKAPMINFIFQTPQVRYQGFLFLEFNSKMKLVDNLKYWGIYNLNSVMISRVLKILASQNWFYSLYAEIFNIDRFVE